MLQEIHYWGTVSCIRFCLGLSWAAACQEQVRQLCHWTLLSTPRNVLWSYDAGFETLHVWFFLSLHHLRRCFWGILISCDTKGCAIKLTCTYFILFFLHFLSDATQCVTESHDALLSSFPCLLMLFKPLAFPVSPHYNDICCTDIIILMITYCLHLCLVITCMRNQTRHCNKWLPY